MWQPRLAQLLLRLLGVYLIVEGIAGEVGSVVYARSFYLRALEAGEVDRWFDISDLDSYALGWMASSLCLFLAAFIWLLAGGG